jgi:CheY-like chemotaxis protein
MHKDDNSPHVLIVEDDADVRIITKLCLTKFGNMQVSEAQSGSEAITKVALNTYDVILLDVMMPEMDGPTTLHELREMPNGASTPIIFLTAKVLPSDIARLQALSTYEVLTKPFDPLTLGDELRRIMRHHIPASHQNEQHDAPI